MLMQNREFNGSIIHLGLFVFVFFFVHRLIFSPYSMNALHQYKLFLSVRIIAVMAAVKINKIKIFN